MTKQEMFEVFGDFDPGEFVAEAEAKWGSGEAFAESARRTKRYKSEDWHRYRTESSELNATIAELMGEEVPPDHERAMDLAERHRQQIDRWFYPCPKGMHAKLGKMYVADPRFKESYDRVRPGLAEYLSEAIEANALRK